MKVIYKTLLVAVICCLLPGFADAAPNIKGVRIGEHPDKTRVVVDLSEKVQANFQYEDKSVKITIPNSDIALEVAKSIKGRGLVASGHIIKNGGVIIYLTPKKDMVVKKMFQMGPGGGQRLVIDLASGKPKQTEIKTVPEVKAKPIPAPQPMPEVKPEPVPEPSPLPESTPEPKVEPSPLPAPIPEPKIEPAPLPEPTPAPEPKVEPSPLPEPVPEPNVEPLPLPEPTPVPAPELAPAPKQEQLPLPPAETEPEPDFPPSDEIMPPIPEKEVERKPGEHRIPRVPHRPMGTAMLEEEVVTLTQGHIIQVPSPLPVSKLEHEFIGSQGVATAMSLGFDRSLPMKEVFVVAIDPGHGGRDPGTVGANGLTEKVVSLAVAHCIADQLKDNPNIRVVLTRAQDEQVPLRDRFRIARKAKADLLISLHVDSNAEKSLQGISVYTLSERASDLEAESLALKENKSDVVMGVDMADASDDVSQVLVNLSQNVTNMHSLAAAKFLITSFKSGEVPLKMVNNHHRQADIAVLKAPDLPSVLIELGYFSNKEDTKKLSNKDYQKLLASRIVDAIKVYFKGA